jgi:hypothetical protein
MSPINEFNTTLELKDVDTKGHLFFNNRPLNLSAKYFSDARYNENDIVT